MKKYLVGSEKELPAVARSLLESYPGRRIFAFHGAMGAGKTTFIKALCRELGVKESPLSPTFNIINEYRTSGGEPVFHIDFYRIGKPEEAYDIGYEEYLFSGHYCFLEWPEKITELLPDETVKVTIRGTDKRTISF